ncbi:hypothetical protein [Alkalimarinus coralli]|uniref:hypothetical protein n=1 Tax=Alkalimarinus coralli TaxID=2935863 RepID=UPI00202B4B03|nr:hypothetical protein [Alkalimarinus coralli]
MINRFNIGVLILVSLPAFAEDYYVHPSGGEGSGSKSDPWSLSYANAQLRPGDKAILRGGNYKNEQIAPSRSGTSESQRIIYQAYPSETPEFRPTKSINSPMSLVGKKYITIDGIDADGGGIYEDSKYNQWILFDGTTHVILKNSKLMRSKGYSAFRFINNSDYNQILNNHVEYNGVWNVKPWKGEYDDSGSMMWIKSGNDHNLIQGNVFKRSGHDLGLIEGSYNVIRDNYYDNFWEVYDGSSFSFKKGDIKSGDKVGNRAIELRKGKRNLVENNIFANIPESVDQADVGITKIGGTYQIVRRNFFINSTSQGAAMRSVLFKSSPIIQYNKIYNNTYYNIGGPAWEVASFDSQYSAPKNNVFKNNIVFKARNRPTSSGRDVEIYFDKSLKGYYGDPHLGNIVAHNCIAYDENASNQQVFSGADSRSSLDNYEDNHPKTFFKNVQQQPDFVNKSPSSREHFMLSDGSRCIDQAGDLTTTRSKGSGTVVPVDDASYFSDGNGIVDGDVIAVGTERVTVKGIDISRNEITLDRSISWSDGAGVNLAVSDYKLDIGALELEEKGTSTSPPKHPKIVNIDRVQ